MENCSLHCADALDFLKSRPSRSIDFTMGSPPYALKGERYGPGSKKWSVDDWILWMYEISLESVRVTKGDVIWVVNNTVKDGMYHPACEGLIWKWYKDSPYPQDRPVIWHKNAPFNRRNYYSNCWEFVICFRANPASQRETWQWERIANPPKYTTGGRWRQRDSKGKRKLGGEYPKTRLARPSDVLYCTVGGGQMGHPLASEGEAPYPESLVEKVLLPLTEVGHLVCDPFFGTGTTAAVALKNGRQFIGCDNRQDQIDLAKRRLADLLKQGVPK